MAAILLNITGMTALDYYLALMILMEFLPVGSAYTALSTFALALITEK